MKEETIEEVLKKYMLFLKKYEEDIEIERFIYLPLNTKKASLSEIEETEKKLSIAIPTKLKNYYLSTSNGTEENSNRYAVDDWRLEIFSHQRIVGVYDYFKIYWDSMCVSIDEINEGWSTKDIDFVNEKNREFFVYAADWDENFIETFVFDKQHNFYRFYFDQDVHIIEYINEMIEGSEFMKTSNSCVELLANYLEEKKEEIIEDINS